MPTSLDLHGVADDLHARLSARAEREGKSLCRYVLGVLTDHAALPTPEEWLGDLARVPPAAPATSCGQDVRVAPEDGDKEEPRWPDSHPAR